MTHFMIFSKQNFVIFTENECCHCFEISKKVSDGQEMTRRSKLPYRPHTGSKKDKVKNSFFNRIVTPLRMLVFQFYFVNHISNHVIEG